MESDASKEEGTPPPSPSPPPFLLHSLFSHSPPTPTPVVPAPLSYSRLACVTLDVGDVVCVRGRSLCIVCVSLTRLVYVCGDVVFSEMPWPSRHLTAAFQKILFLHV